MFKKKLANEENYRKGMNNSYDLLSSKTVYEVFIQLAHDKDGNVLKDKKGNDRYYAVDDTKVTTLASDITVKKVREDFYKKVYEVNGDYVDKFERDDGKRVYNVVNPDKIVTLPAGSNVIMNKNDGITLLNEVGYVLVDDIDIDHPKIIRSGKFLTEDHEAEAKAIARGKSMQHSDDDSEAEASQEENDQ